MTNSLEAIKRYLDMREKQPLKGIDDTIHAIHTGTEFAAELRLSDLKAIFADRPAQGSADSSANNSDIRWAVNVLLEKIAAKFKAHDTFDIWRSDAAAIVRSFKHDLSAPHAERATVDLTNHHNALLCPYCNPKGRKFAESQSPAANEWKPPASHYDYVDRARSQPVSRDELACKLAEIGEWSTWLEAADAILSKFNVTRKSSFPSTEKRSGKVCAYHDGCPPDGPVCHLCQHLQEG